MDILREMIDLTSQDAAIRHLNFKPYRNSAIRKAIQFTPAPAEPQSTEVVCPWGATLVARQGDYIVSELGAPEDRWPVEKRIFEQTYVELEPGTYLKRQITDLVPLTDLTGDPDQKVRVHTLEGIVTVRAGDFYLARGIEGEIWPYPKDKADSLLRPVTA